MKNRKRIAAIAMAVAVTITSIPINPFSGTVKASASETNAVTLDKTDYKEVWADEFEGTALNREDWNVELHQPGWVNSELQSYVDSEENISVKDGKLYLTPVKKVTKINTAGNLISNADFANGTQGWTETIANWEGAGADASSKCANGTITYDINNVGTADWNIQLKQQGIQLVAGNQYRASYKIKSSQARTVKSGIMNNDYVWYGGSDPVLEAGKETEVSFEFTMSVSDEVNFYISMGQILDKANNKIATPASKITISDISLIDITPGNDTEKEVVSYTSGRINTQGKHDFTYGLFEVKAKVPAGQGYLPAFWLMATDENVYGQWPRCGEIDCMEVMGQEPNKVYGTIHYGNPHSESQNTYITTTGKDFSKDFHVFSCEWEPGSIKWYCDGVLYHEEHDWHSTTEGKGTLSYPAPFDQPFYMILNLAVGGSWVGNPDETTSFDNNPYIVDYVRVYQKDSYDENVTKPEKEVILRDPDSNGNYINNGTFATVEDLTDDDNWSFKTALGGTGTASISDNTMKVETTSEGTVDYSIQLVQANVPLEKGATYEVSFDAWASESRTMASDIKAPDRGYTSYMPSLNCELTTSKKTFTQTFKMTSDSDANARLEYNMGAKNSTATIYIQNVSIKKIKAADPNEVEEKTILSNGNYIYNGEFQEGTAHLGDWEFVKQDASEVLVTSLSDGRRLKVSPNGAQVIMSQKDLAFTSGKDYILSFQADTDAERELSINVGGKSTIVKLLPGENKTYSVKFSSADKFTNRNVSFDFGTTGTFYLDNIMLAEDKMIKNGSFDNGLTGYEVYVDSSANASYVVDSIKEQNALDVTINHTSDQDWKIQIKQNNVPLEQGKWYKLTLKAKSDMERKIRVIMQGTEARNYAVYSNDNVVTLNNSYQTITDVFQMNQDSDSAAFLSICLGMVDGEIIKTQHRVVIDDIVLVETKDPSQSDDADNRNEEDSNNGSGNNVPGNSGSGNQGSEGENTNPSDTPSGETKPSEEDASDIIKTVITDDESKSKLELTKKENGTAEVVYAGTTDDDATVVEVPAEITIDGVVYPVTKIQDNAFKNNDKVTRIIVGKNITEIGKNAFAGCENLERIVIGKKVERIGSKAFKNCKSLNVIEIKSKKLNAKNIAEDAFKNVKKGTKIVVPAKKVEEYKVLFVKKGLSRKVKVVAKKEK